MTVIPHIPHIRLSDQVRRRLDPESIGRLLEPLVAPQLISDESSLVRLFARITWNSVVEPGDGAAGALTSLLGPESCFALADGHIESVAEALAGFHAGELELAKAMHRWAPRLDLERVAGLCESAAKVGLRFISPEDPAWPSALDDLGDHAPQGLWFRGRADVLARSDRSVAIVGSRASSPYGERVAGDLAAEVSTRSLAVVSGGAYGIDAAAHRAALAATGSTIAILAGGADRLYPAGNRALLERIGRDGAVITEAPVGQSPTRWRFLQRNRLIAALAQATIVVEAGSRSGALNTANHAMHLGRPLGAVPGPVTSAASVGCHRLLKEQHAQLVEHSEDVTALWQEGAVTLPTSSVPEPIDARTVSPAVQPGDDSSGLSMTAIRARDALRPRRRRRIAELARESGMSPQEVRAGLVELQLAGLAEEDEGGWRKAQGSALF